MSVEENKALIRRWFDDVLNGGDWDLGEELLSAEFVGMSGDNREERKQRWTTNHDAFPDLWQTVDELIAEGDKVVVRQTICGTHTGSECLGLPPSGKRFEIPMVHIYRVADGKIVEEQVLFDSLGLWQQLGVVPPLEEMIEEAKSKQA